MIEKIDLFRLAGARMDYLAERQSVIARNIANADTPGYTARDLTPFSFANVMARQGGTAASTGPGLEMARTSTAHLTATPAASAAVTAAGVPAKPSGNYGEKPDGNRVSIEEQMIKAADNTSAFALVSAAYAKSISIMKLSIDK